MKSYRNFISRATVLNTDLPTGEKLLLIVLRAFQDCDTGKCHPSKLALCRCCGMVMNTMKKHRLALREKGFIDWKVDKTTCHYTFKPKSVDDTAESRSINGVGYDEDFVAPSNDPLPSGCL